MPTCSRRLAHSSSRSVTRRSAVSAAICNLAMDSCKAVRSVFHFAFAAAASRRSVSRSSEQLLAATRRVKISYTRAAIIVVTSLMASRLWQRRSPLAAVHDEGVLLLRGVEPRL